MKQLFVALVLSGALAACQSTSIREGWVRSELYFGLSRPDGSFVSDKEWHEFVDEVVTPRFAAGLSVVDAVGQWRHEDGHIQAERSKVLVLLHPANGRIEADVEAIRVAYCRRFSQEAVMKVSSPAQVSFHAARTGGPGSSIYD